VAAVDGIIGVVVKVLLHEVLADNIAPDAIVAVYNRQSLLGHTLRPELPDTKAMFGFVLLGVGRCFWPLHHFKKIRQPKEYY
jgi:hypothetical protein